MEKSSSCNSLRMHNHSSKLKKHHVSTPKKMICVLSRGPKMVKSDYQVHPKTKYAKGAMPLKIDNRETIVSRTWSTRNDAVPMSAPDKLNPGWDSVTGSSTAPEVFQTEEPLPEKDYPKQGETLNMLNKNLESFKSELLQCKDAAQYSETKVAQLAEEMEVARIASSMEKDNLLRQISILTKTVADQRAQVKHLTEINSEKDTNLINCKNLLCKVDASSKCRAATIKSLKQEILLLRKDLAEATSSESLMQRSNKELLTENHRLKQTLEDVKDKLMLLQDYNNEWEKIVNKQVDMLTKEGEANHLQCNVKACQKLGSLKALYDHRLQLVLKKLFRADQKTKQLYQTIEKVIKGVHFHLHEDKLEKLNNFENHLHMEGTRNLPEKNVVLHLCEWLNACHKMVYRRDFSDNLSKLVLDLLNNEKTGGEKPFAAPH